LDEPTLPHGEPYRPLGRRAQIVTILLIIGIGTAIAGIVSGAMERSLLDDVQQGRLITPKQADDNDRRQLIVAVVDGTVFIASFSTQGAWLVQDDADLTFEYVSGGYHINLKKPGLWSSIRALPDEVESLSMDAEASAENIDLKTDFFGISCLTASDESFLFGMSPDGYYTVAYDPGGDEQLEFQRLIEDSALLKFSTPNAVNQLRAECVRDGDAMKLGFFVNGKRLTETQHESSGRLVGVELFVYSEKGGTDIRFDNVFVWPVPQ
jgi:hypothetical protein